jgi:hypothetical protein
MKIPCTKTIPTATLLLLLTLALPKWLTAQQAPASNPYEWLGQLHNTALADYHARRGDSADTSAIDLMLEVANSLQAHQPAVQTAQFQALAPKVWTWVHAQEAPELYRLLRLSPAQVRHIEALLHMPDHYSPMEAQAYVQATEAQIMADGQLASNERNLPLACVAIARNSADYWAEYYDMERFVVVENDTIIRGIKIRLEDLKGIKPLRLDTIILGDTLRLDKFERPIPPFGRVMKADFFGLLKGMVGGVIIWVVSDLPKVNFDGGLAVGIAFAVVAPVVESALYNWKFRRGRVKRPDDTPDEWEIYRN